MSNEYAPDSRQSVDLKWKLRKALEKNVAPRDDGKGLDFGQDVGVDGKLHLNELSDIVGPSGSPLFTNDTQENVSATVDELVANWYVGRYSGSYLYFTMGAERSLYPDYLKNLATNVDLAFSGASIDMLYDPSGEFFLPEFGSQDVKAYEMCIGMKAIENVHTLVLGDCRLYDAGRGFSRLQGFTHIKVADGKTAKFVNNASECFSNSSSLQSIEGIDLSECNEVGGLTNAFLGCSSLASLSGCKGWKISFDVSGTAMGHDALVELIGELETVTTAETLTLGDDKLALLSDEEKLGATNKGWTLA